MQKQKEKEMKHILICGRRQVGKSTLVERLLAEINLPVYGVITKSMVKREDGFHEIYMFRANDKDRIISEENHLADCDAVHRKVNLNIFETLGVQYLNEVKSDGIIVMDELGFMEADAKAFCSRVLEILDGDIPVIATAKSTHPNVDFLNRVRNHPNVDLYMIDENNRDELYEQLLPIVKSLNR